MLLLLHHGPAHGYTLLEGLGDFGLAYLDASGVYWTLRDMEAKGRVVSTWDEDGTQGPPRRVYWITVLGDEMLALWVHDLEENRERIDHLLNVYQHI